MGRQGQPRSQQSWAKEGRRGYIGPYSHGMNVGWQRQAGSQLGHVNTGQARLCRSWATTPAICAHAPSAPSTSTFYSHARTQGVPISVREVAGLEAARSGGQRVAQRVAGGRPGCARPRGGALAGRSATLGPPRAAVAR
jgi:hypothetical protein